MCVLPLHGYLRSSRNEMLFLSSACVARDRESLVVFGNKMVGTIPSDVIALASLTYVQLCPCKCGVITAIVASLLVASA